MWSKFVIFITTVSSNCLWHDNSSHSLQADKVTCGYDVNRAYYFNQSYVRLDGGDDNQVRLKCLTAENPFNCDDFENPFKKTACDEYCKYQCMEHCNAFPFYNALALSTCLLDQGLKDCYYDYDYLNQHKVRACHFVKELANSNQTQTPAFLNNGTVTIYYIESEPLREFRLISLGLIRESYVRLRLNDLISTEFQDFTNFVYRLRLYEDQGSLCNQSPTSRQRLQNLLYNPLDLTNTPSHHVLHHAGSTSRQNVLINKGFPEYNIDVSQALGPQNSQAINSLPISLMIVIPGKQPSFVGGGDYTEVEASLKVVSQSFGNQKFSLAGIVTLPSSVNSLYSSISLCIAIGIFKIVN